MARTSPLSCIETLHMMTLIIRLPRYSGCNRKKRVVILLPASFFFFAAYSEGSRTSQVAKLLRQKYLPGMFAVLRKSSKVSYFNPACLLVLRSVTTKDKVFGSTASTNSGMVNISLSLICLIIFPYLASLSALSLS